jgi:periplasmic divalent cation tolerance protein
MLVGEHLVGCVSILPNVESIYRWEGKIESSTEALCLCKTTQSKWLPLQARLKELHPYEVPEIIALPITEGWPPYLQWLAAQCGH